MPDAHEKPNILITGTPGTGKTTFATQLASELQLEVMSVTEIAAQNDFYCGEDAELQTKILDDDAVLDHMEDRLNSSQGGVVVEYHGCDFFPERWFDLVLVLRADTAILYDRLKARGYAETKLQNNVQSEIFGMLLEEAKESYPDPIVVQLQSNTPDDEEANVNRVRQWLEAWEVDKASRLPESEEGME